MLDIFKAREGKEIYLEITDFYTILTRRICDYFVLNIEDFISFHVANCLLARTDWMMMMMMMMMMLLNGREIFPYSHATHFHSSRSLIQ